MKKLTACGLVLLLTLLLCGCSISDYSEPEQQYIVSAIGFDDDGGRIRVSVEVIIIESENAQSQTGTRVFSGTGKTIEQAFNQLSGGIAKGLMLTHCGILIIGSSLDKKELAQLLEYCFREEALTLAANMVAAENAEQLLQCRSISSPVVGYDLLSLLREKSRYMGIGLQSAFYQIQQQRAAVRSVFALPYFSIRQSAAESNYALDGLKVFVSDTAVATLDPDDSILYSMLCNRYRGGLLSVEQDGMVRQAAVYGSSTKTAFSREHDRLHIDVEVHITLSDRQTADVDREGLCKSIEQALLRFTAQIKKRTNADPFGFSVPLSGADRALWNEISADYDAEFYKADIAVSCDITQKD